MPTCCYFHLMRATCCYFWHELIPPAHAQDATNMFIFSMPVYTFLYLDQACTNIIRTCVVIGVLGQGFIQDFFVGGGGGTFFYCRETMWLIDHSEGKGMGGVCPLPCCTQCRSLLLYTLFDCHISIVGNAIMSSTGTATFYF